MISTDLPADGDTLAASWNCIYDYDGVPDTMFTAAIEWTNSGILFIGDLDSLDLDYTGYQSGEGYVIKMFDFEFCDTTTHFVSETLRQSPLPGSVDSHAETSCYMTGSAPGQVATEPSTWGRIKAEYK
jgi:hypothetical protein